MIKLDIISGFLGAGKTTLIQKLFAEAFKKEKIVLIENEFGEIGVDGSFLKESGINIKEINSGCICCSLVGDFNKSLDEVIEKYAPERIIIEPSGVGKLSDIKKACAKHSDKLVLNIVATVVDGGKAKMYARNFGEFFIDQVSEANTIVVAKVDKIDVNKLNETLEVLKSINGNSTIITTSLKELDGEKLLSTLESKVDLLNTMLEDLQKQAKEDRHHHHHEGECDDPECSCHHHHHDEDEEHECCHHHHHDEDEHECCHHHHDEGDEEHECCHHHHHEGECDDPECLCHHHHHEGECDDPECSCHHHHHEGECDDPECSCHHHHDADEVFTSWGIETAKAKSKEELTTFLEALKDESIGEVLRSKGIIKASDNEKWYYFDYVAGDYEIRLGDADYTGRVCVIGSHLDEERISNLFNK